MSLCLSDPDFDLRFLDVVSATLDAAVALSVSYEAAVKNQKKLVHCGDEKKK